METLSSLGNYADFSKLFFFEPVYIPVCIAWSAVHLPCIHAFEYQANIVDLSTQGQIPGAGA